MAIEYPPDAIFASEDITALGVIGELKERKIKIPAEVGVIDFANEFFEDILPHACQPLTNRLYIWESLLSIY